MDFSKLDSYIDSLDKLGVPACNLSIYRDHELVHRRMAGHPDAAGRENMRGDEVYWLYSMTKVITCASAMRLVERGLIELDDRVSDYLPAFGMLTVAEGDATRAAKNALTVRHLMSMQSGMDYDLNAPAIKVALEAYGPKASTRQLVDAMAHKPLIFDPGTGFNYSLSHDVLAALIEVASGKRFGDYLKREIFEPLGMRSTGFRLTEELRARLAAQYMYDGASKSSHLMQNETNVYALSDEYESGGAGLLSDAHDYGVFADALACGGLAANGARVLLPETIDIWRAPHLPESTLGRPGYSYALGVRTLVEREKSGARSALGEFGWDGAAGSYVAIDPANRLAIVYLQHVRGCTPCGGDGIHVTVRDMVYDAMGL